MEWQLAFLLIFGSFAALLVTGLPVAFCFILVDVIGVIFFLGGLSGLTQLVYSMLGSLASYSLVPLPMYILMGELMFHSGVAPKMLDALDQWLGRLPGRLSLLATGGGVLMATVSGSSMGSVAMLGSTLVPEMEKRGYKKEMSLGPILGSSGLAIMIPPSGLAVLLGAVAGISIGQILIAIILPGLIMAVAYAVYTLARCKLQPSLAPPYDAPELSLSVKLTSFCRYILPLGFVIFMVTGVIFFGIATPAESAALGAIATFVLAAAYKKLNWQMVKKSIMGTVQITVMMFLIIAGAEVFSQVLVFSEVSRGLVKFVLSVPMSPIMIVVMMMVLLLFLGCFMDSVAMLMITIPLYMPIVQALGIDQVWFAVLLLLCCEVSGVSPPFGMTLFTMKGVAPSNTTMGDIYLAALPYVGCDLVVLAILILFPNTSLWLPSLMRNA